MPEAHWRSAIRKGILDSRTRSAIEDSVDELGVQLQSASGTGWRFARPSAIRTIVR